MEKGLNRNQLKYVAIIAMLIDHIGMFFVSPSSPAYIICRFIGRLTAPIMCYFLTEGYNYTSSKFKYGVRLFIFSIISQFAYSLAHYKVMFAFNFNMIFTLFLCFLVLLSYEKIRNKMIRWSVIVCIVLFSYFCDWGIYAPLWVLFFYIFREKTTAKVISFYIITTVVIIVKYMIFYLVHNYYLNSVILQFGIFLFIPFMYLYNGNKGKSNRFNKWFFYIFYPLHFFIIALIRFCFV